MNVVTKYFVQVEIPVTVSSKVETQNLDQS